MSPFEAAATALLCGEVARMLTGLDCREREVIRLRFGLNGGEPRTLEEVGVHFGLTRERIRKSKEGYGQATTSDGERRQPDANQRLTGWRSGAKANYPVRLLVPSGHCALHGRTADCPGSLTRPGGPMNYCEA